MNIKITGIRTSFISAEGKMDFLTVPFLFSLHFLSKFCSKKFIALIRALVTGKFWEIMTYFIIAVLYILINKRVRKSKKIPQ